MSKEKKIICVLSGIIAGILISTMLIGNGFVNAKSIRATNTEKAFWIFAENYDEWQIEPVSGLAILNGESRAMTAKNNHGCPYGMVGHRYYDIESGTYAFGNLIRYNRWYKNAWKCKTWQTELAAIQRCGYCQDGSNYLSYLHSIVRTYNLTKYEKKFKKYRKKILKERREKKRKKKQKQPFTLIYNPALAPWQVITYRGVIKGGTIRIDTDNLYGFLWLDVIKTKKGSKNIIYTGDRKAMFHSQVKLAEILEEAVG